MTLMPTQAGMQFNTSGVWGLDGAGSGHGIASAPAELMQGGHDIRLFLNPPILLKMALSGIAGR